MGIEKCTFVTVRRFADRRKPCLMLEQGNTGVVIGTFRNEACAEAFEKFTGGSIYRQMDETLDELLGE